MAEAFLEEIYSKSILISDFEQAVELIYKDEIYKAKDIYNTAISSLENLFPEIAKENKSLADRMLGCAVKIAESWSDYSVTTGTIRNRLIPLLYEYMSYFGGIDVVEGDFCFKSTDAGFLMMSDIKNNIAFHESHNPMVEAYYKACSVYQPSNREVHILGCDLGYLPYMIYRISDGATKIVIYESDQKLLDYAIRFGVLSWIPDECLQIEKLDSSSALIGMFLTFTDNYEDDIEKEHIAVYINRWKAVQLEKEGIEAAWKKAEMINYHRNRGKLCVINMMKNYSKSSVKFNDIKMQLNYDEWVVVAAGPSLDENISFIKDAVGSKGIVIVNTVIKRMYTEDIKPDLVTAADPVHKLVSHIAGYEDFTANIPIIADETISWKFIDRYKGRLCFIPTPNGEGLPLSNPDQSEIWEISGTVSTLAIEAAIHLGARKIYLVGLDLAYPGGVSYASGVSQKRTEDRGGDLLVKSVDGSMVYTSHVFDLFRIAVEQTIQKHPEVDFINLSRHGALIKGAK